MYLITGKVFELANNIAEQIYYGKAKQDDIHENVYHFNVNELDFDFPTDENDLRELFERLYETILDYLRELGHITDEMTINIDDDHNFDDSDDPDTHGDYFYTDENGVVCFGNDDEDDYYFEDEDEYEEDEEEYEGDEYQIAAGIIYDKKVLTVVL